MKAPVFTLVVCALVLTACGESRLNPFNWFGREEAAPRSEAPDRPDVLDRTGLVQQVTDLRIDRTPGGAIIRATGLPPTQGYWGAGLEPVADERPVDGVLTYRFRIEAPIGRELAGNRQSREVIVARAVSDAVLEGVRVVRVMGAANDLSRRR